MLDVHPPHDPIHGWRDFLLHLFTITIGLLIALSLEGCVEWQHHRHLVHEAEAGLHTEIISNAGSLHDVQTDIHSQQQHLEHDVIVLRYVVANGKLPEHGEMQIDFHLSGFDDVSWKTAQTTGALAYMPYSTAREYAEIYGLQTQLLASEQIAVRDAILSVARFSGSNPGDVPSKEDAVATIAHIQVLQGQLMLLDSLIKALDAEYKKFLTAHP